MYINDIICIITHFVTYLYCMHVSVFQNDESFICTSSFSRYINTFLLAIKIKIKAQLTLQ